MSKQKINYIGGSRVYYRENGDVCIYPMKGNMEYTVDKKYVDKFFTAQDLFMKLPNIWNFSLICLGISSFIKGYNDINTTYNTHYQITIKNSGDLLSAAFHYLSPNWRKLINGIMYASPYIGLGIVTYYV